MLQLDPPLHHLQRAVHPAAEDGPELVEETLDDEGGYRRIVFRLGEAYGELLGLHRDILSESDPQPMSRRRMI